METLANIVTVIAVAAKTGIEEMVRILNNNNR